MLKGSPKPPCRGRQQAAAAARDAGNGVDPLGAVVDHLGDTAGLLKAVAADRHGHREHVVSVESGIDRLQLHECTNEQRRSDDQHKSESHLADDQNGTHLAAAEAYSGAVAALVQNCRKVLTGGGDRRHQAKENSGQQRNSKREQKTSESTVTAEPSSPMRGMLPGLMASRNRTPANPRISPRIPPVRDITQALREQLANDVPASGAERRTRCEFPLASGGANQQQIRNVGTGNQEHKSDGAKQHVEG